MKRKNRGEIRTITGNAAAAYGAILCRPDVVALYPITPQTELVEQLSRTVCRRITGCRDG